MSNLIQAIQNLGLSENESRIYLALLELGRAGVAAIAAKAEVKRTSCYVILDELIRKGLVSTTQTAGRVQYAAEPPETLLRLGRERVNQFDALLPELKSLFNLSDNKPRIRFYEGKESYVAICEDSLARSGKEIWLVSNLDNLQQIITKEYDDTVYIPTRMQAGKKLLMATFKSPSMDAYRAKDAEQLREIRYLPDNMKFNASMFIYGDTISLISSEKELIGLIIDSAPLAAMAKAMFQASWQLAK